jgi:hypothetical protein
LAVLPELTILPQPPHTNMFHLFLRGDRTALERALLEVAAETGTWLFHPLRPCQLPGYWMAEWVVGDASLDIAPDATVELLHTVLRRATDLGAAEPPIRENGKAQAAESQAPDDMRARA